MKKVLVTGGNGQLGSELKLLELTSKVSFVFIDIDDLDLTDSAAVDTYFQINEFDFIVNCAAHTAVDKAEEEAELSTVLNANVPELLAQKIQNQGGKIIHISTDFVFEGNQNLPIVETSNTNPLGVYGKTKLAGEEAVQKATAQHFIIRTSWLYSSFGNNFVKTILRLTESREELGIIFDQVGTPTYARDLAKAIIRIVEKDSTQYGVYHYSNEGIASWYDFAIAIVDLFELSVKINPIKAIEYPTSATRPVFSAMDKSKFKEVFNIDIPHWRHSLTECKTVMNQT